MSDTPTLPSSVNQAFFAISYINSYSSAFGFTLSTSSTGATITYTSPTTNMIMSFVCLQFVAYNKVCPSSQIYFNPNDSLCYATCPYRLYANTTNNKCLSCPFDCYTCDSTGANCLSCNPTTDFRTLSGTRCIPMSGYYESNVTTASACSSGCSVCPNNTYCTVCKPNNFLRADNLCYTACLPGYYANTNSNTCAQCPSICITCLSPTYCSECSSSAFLRSDHFCYSICLATTYA